MDNGKKALALVLALWGCGGEGSGPAGAAGAAGAAGGAGESVEGGSGAAGAGGAWDGGPERGDASLSGFGRRDGAAAGQDGGGQSPDAGLSGVLDGGLDAGEPFDPTFFVGRWEMAQTAQTDCDGKPMVAPTGKSEITVNTSFEVFGSSGTRWLKPGVFEGEIWRPEPAFAGMLDDAEVWREGETAAGRYRYKCAMSQPGNEVSMVWERLAP